MFQDESYFFTTETTRSFFPSTSLRESSLAHSFVLTQQVAFHHKYKPNETKRKETKRNEKKRNEKKRLTKNEREKIIENLLRFPPMLTHFPMIPLLKKSRI